MVSSIIRTLGLSIKGMGLLSLTLFALALLALPVGYIWLCGAMRRAAVRHPPYVHFLFIFGAVGTLVLSVAFMGSVPGALVGVLSAGVAPIAILLSSCFLYWRHQDSRFHSAAFWSGLAYVALIMVIITMVASL